MAFKTINKSEEIVNRLYTGVTTAKVVAVNPTKAEMEKLYNTTVQNDPQYKGTTQTGEKNMRISFVLEVNVGTDRPKLVNLTFFVADKPVMGKNSGKTQIIDKYGRTAWATPEDIENKRIPQYKSGPARIDSAYRGVYQGEEQLEKFIRTLLCLDDPEYYDSMTGSYKTRTGEALEKCEGILDSMDAIVNGDIDEIKGIVRLAENNEVKILLGIRDGANGRQYQEVFTDNFVKNTSRLDNAVKYFEKSLNDALAVNKYKSSTFEVSPVHEYKVVPTSFSSSEETKDIPETDSIGEVEDMPEEFPED